jgi:hypothetical protein
MRKFAAVVLHEWAARRNVALLACVLAVIPWLVRFYAGFRVDELAEARRLVAAVLGVAFAFSFAALLGATMIARDVAERRASFYTRLPAGASIIYLGKLTANALLVISGGALIGATAIGMWPWQAAFVVLLIPPLMAIVHYVSIGIRAGGLGLLVDLALLLAAAGAAYGCSWPFRALDARYAGYVLTALWAVAWIAASFIAGIAHVRAGGFDVRVAAMRARTALWGTTLGLAVALDLLYAVYVVAMPPRDACFAAPVSPNWIGVAFTDAARLDYVRYALLNLHDGRQIDFAKPLRRVAGEARLSLDGRHAFWRPWNEETRSLFHVDLVHARAEELSVGGGAYAMAPDGSAIAALSAANVIIYAIPGGRRVREVATAREDRVRMVFDDADHLRIVECGAAGVRIRIVDVATGAERTMAVPLERPSSQFQEVEISRTTRCVAASRTADPLNPAGAPRPSILIIDDGARLLGEIVPKQPFESFSWLSDGRLAVVSHGLRADRKTLTIYDEKRNEVRAFDLERSFLDSRILPAGGPYVVVDQKVVTRVFDVDRGTETNLPGGIVVLADGRGHLLAANGVDIRRFDLRTGKSDVVFHGHQVPEWIQRLQPPSGF